jgi:PAS domain S-box-containing protein
MRRERERSLRRLIIVTTLEALGALIVRVTLTVTAARGGTPPAWLDELGVVFLMALPVQFWILWVVWRQQVQALDHVAVVEHRLDSMLRTTSEWGWSIDRTGRIGFSSDASSEFVGYAPADLVGRPVADVCDADGAARLQALLSSADGASSGWRGVAVNHVHRDGRIRTAETTAVPVRDIAGRHNGFECSSRLLGEEAVARLLHDERRRRVEDVLERHAVATAFQPIVRLRDGQVAGVEALTRFVTDHPRSPDTWFRDAVAVGLGIELEVLTMTTALGRAAVLPEHLVLSLNASPALLMDPALLQVLGGSGLSYDRIVLEVTEHSSVEDYEAFTTALDALRRRGLRVAVDDAGAGFASFRHILRLRPDTIKLDRELIRGIDGDAARRALAAAVVMFAREIGAQVTAEGVETDAELDAVTALGLDFVQGYLLGRPTSDPAVWGAWTGTLAPVSPSATPAR